MQEVKIMEKSQFNSEERKKALLVKGPFNYILIHGVIGWGLPTVLLFSLLMYWMGEAASFIEIFKISIILFPVAGLFFGAFMW